MGDGLFIPEDSDRVNVIFVFDLIEDRRSCRAVLPHKLTYTVASFMLQLQEGRGRRYGVRDSGTNLLKLIKYFQLPGRQKPFLQKRLQPQKRHHDQT